MRRPVNEARNNPERYLRNVEDTYVFDLATGLYKPKTCIEKTLSDNKKPGSNPQFRFFTNPKRDWLAMAVGVVTLVVLAIYTGYTRKQWKEAQRTADQSTVAANAAACAARTSQNSLQFARDSFHISERPYVTVSSISFDTPLEPDKEIGMSIIADNSGHTPALKVAFAGAAYIDGKMIEGKFINLKGESVIPSQHPTKAHYTLSFTAADFNRIIYGNALRINGTIRYTDIFEEWHSTSYCAIYDGREKLFKFCPSGNEVK
jgi:hypothetical protein